MAGIIVSLQQQVQFLKPEIFTFKCMVKSVLRKLLEVKLENKEEEKTIPKTSRPGTKDHNIDNSLGTHKAIFDSNLL